MNALAYFATENFSNHKCCSLLATNALAYFTTTNFPTMNALAYFTTENFSNHKCVAHLATLNSPATNALAY